MRRQKPLNRPETKILILYSELAGYFLACLEHLTESYEVDVHLVRWPVNRDAPFDFQIPEKVVLYERKELNDESLLSLANIIKPDLILSSGWMDKGYNRVCKTFRDQIPVIASMDNHWTGSFRQKFASLISPLTFKRYFTHILAAGEPQKNYARKLGFGKEYILESCYSADVDSFNEVYRTYRDDKAQSYPHRFLYVGRYIERKGIRDLWRAFTELSEELPHDWELWCAGTGELETDKCEHNKIRHLGFLQPDDLTGIAKETGVFVLPSYFEPWGVAVHEFAAAGFPLICSDKVGAATKFLDHGRNGYLFSSGDKDELKKYMRRVIVKADHELLNMGDESVALASGMTPEIWSRNLINLVQPVAKEVV